METSSSEETDSHSSKTELDAASGTASLKTSESDSMEVVTSTDMNEDVNKIEITENHQSFENFDNDDSNVTENKTSATAPGKPDARDIGCNYILLEWEKPSEREMLYYEIRFKTMTDTTWRRPVFTDFDKPCHQLRGLEPDTEYELKVRAHYQDKEGDFSEKSNTFMTKSQVNETPPSNDKHHRQKPGKPTALDVREEHVKLGWDQPEDRNVKFYEIQFKSSEDVNWSGPVFTENANAFYRVDRLQPATRYYFKVKSHYRTFEGIYSEVSDIIRTTQTLEQGNVSYDRVSSSQPGKPAALEVGCDYACIAWDKPVKSDLEYYEVKLKITGDECWFKMPIFTRDNTPYKRVADLMPEIQYEFKVRGHYQEDEGQFSEKSDPVLTKQSSMFKDGSSDTTTSKVPSRKPGKLCSLAVGRDFTDLRWDAPEDRNVSYYELKSKRTRSQAWDKMPVFTEDAKTFLRVTNLLSTTCYVFKVRAHFQDDEGPFSDVSDIIATSGDVENTDERENVLSVVQFQGKCSPTDEDNFSIPSEGLTWYRSPRQTDGGYCADYLRMGQGHRMVTEPRSLSSTNVLPIRKEDYLFHGPFLETFPSSEGSTTKSLTAHYSNQTRNDSQVKHSNRPGKPTRSDSGSDFIRLIWVAPDDKNVLYYEVKNKLIQDELWSKNSATTTDDSPQIFVRGLLQDTEYTFKVRAHYKNGEGDFSGQSDAISTLQSPALSVRNVCVKLQGGEPAFYKLPLKENMDARSTEYKTRKCEFGSSDRLQEKTIMMIGATGSGKSTLIDGMVNHLLGVKWADDFRFKIIDLMTEEEAKRGLETESQTDWITSYRVHPMNRTVKFICNIIDTPGFGDTRGIGRDHQLVDQIRAFFDTKGVKGIETIDAVCFVTQAPLARLTQTQRYIYDSILSIFGKDMKDNIVAMVTFADGKEPPVLNALMQAEIPIKMHFIFNNSALFEPNTESKCNRFGKMFWEMGFLSYQGFFNFLPLMKTQSLQLTAEVLNKRDQLNTTVEGLLPQIDMGLFELETMRVERELVEKFEREIQDNQNFTYEATEIQQNKRNLNPGEMMDKVRDCGNYLRNNAIKINPLTELEYLDVLIESERQQRKPGFCERVKMLRGLKRSAEFKAKSIRLTPQQILKDMGLQDMHM